MRLVASDLDLPLDALIDAARLAERSGQWDDALEGYHAALARIRAGEQPERGPQVQRWKARVLFERGDYDQASRAFEASLVDAQTMARRDDAAHALNGMAVVEQFRGRLDVAEALYQRSCALADEVGNRRLAAMLDQNLGTLANVRGDLAAALARYRAALERFRELGDDRACAWVLNNMGMLHTDLGEWAAADLCFRSADTHADRMGDEATRAKVEGNRAELYLKRQNFEAARECCERAHRLFSQLSSDTGLGEVHKFYGVLYRETGKPQLAHVQLGLALKLARSCENPLLEAETESERARLFLAQKQARQALQSLNRAHRLFSDLDSRREILDLRRRLDRLETAWVHAAEIAAEDAPPPFPPMTNERRGQRVAELATMLASDVGYEELTWIRVGAFLHDVGNRSVPTEVLEKPGPLTAEEMKLIQKHTLHGEKLVEELDFPAGVRPLVRNHHEHWDGSGYPDGLAGEQIPLGARLICIADVYDALTSRRSFRPAFSSPEALEIMQNEAGRIFDPHLFQRFARLIRQGRTVQAGEAAHQLQDVI